MDIEHVANPAWKWFYFPYKKGSDHILIFILYHNPMSNDEIQELCDTVKIELSLKLLEWELAWGRCLFWCSLEDLPRVYEIVNAFLRKGRRIYMYDGSQVSFDTTETASHTLQLDKFLKNLKGKPDAESLTYLPIHRSNFWISQEGKDFSAYLREMNYLKDENDPKEMSLSEFFAEGT